MDLKKYDNVSKKIDVSGKNIVPYVLSLVEYMKSKGLNIEPYPKLNVVEDPSLKEDVFGKTAYYDPEDKSVTLFTSGRHIKDILRSFAHEMIHHDQNLSGKLKDQSKAAKDPKYIQNDEYLRKIEEDAYLRGNLLFREWTENVKK